MTDKRIVYTRSDGRVIVLTPAPRYRNADETEDAFLARVAAKDVPSGLSYQIMDKAEVPPREDR